LHVHYCTESQYGSLAPTLPGIRHFGTPLETGAIMQATTYGIKVDVALPWDAAVTRTTDALKMEGFGVLTTIDVQATLRAKLDREFRKYVILGACNPVLADRALHAELEVGLLLPCNVIVYETGPGHAVVAAMAPLAALGIVGDNPALHAVAVEADARLRRALQSLVTQGSVTNASNAHL